MIENQILITGKSGFLGSVCFRHLLENNVVDSLGRDTDNTLQFSLTNSDIKINKSYDLVIHIAGKAHCIPKTALEKKAFFDVNVLGTKNLLKALTLAPTLPKSFVFISSVSVYGLDNGENIAETHPLAAESPYGLSKIQAEKLVQSWCEEKGVRFTILRLPLLIGKNAPGNMRKLVTAIRKGYYVNIAGGNARKSMVLVEDVVKAILPAAEVGGTYNLTDGFHPSFKELSTFLAQKLHKKDPANIPFWLATLMAKIGDFVGIKSPFNSVKLSQILSTITFDDKKARLAFGWEPKKVLSQFNGII